MPATPDNATSYGVPTLATGGRISYAIFHLAKLHRARAGALLRHLGLYPGQELALMTLNDRDNLIQAELVDYLQLDASTVTRMVARLERQGLVSRQPSEHDRRATAVSLTPEGHERCQRIRAMWDQLERETVGGLSTEDQATLQRLLDLAAANVSAQRT